MLFLVHHGDAVGPDVNPMRPLSDRGRLQVDMLAQNAAEHGAKPDVIWHSGKLRARQTAEAYLETLQSARGVFPATRGPATDRPHQLIIDTIAGDTRHILLADTFRTCRGCLRAS